MTDRRVSVALLVAFLLGCAQPVRPVTAKETTEHVLLRNYKLGEVKTVYVGEEVVKFKDYYLRRTQGRTMRASVGFRVTTSDPLQKWSYVSAAEDYPVTGSLAIEGAEYAVVSLNSPRTPTRVEVLVDSNGKPYKKIMAARIFLAGTARYDPPDVTFLPGPETVTADATAFFKNFELVYGGTDGKSFTLTYREYSPEDLIRPAFTQNLTYANGSTAVRFRNTRLAIQEVTSEKITYSVITDESEAKK